MAEGGKELLHEDGSTMIIRNEDGSTIKVAKRGLHKFAQDQLRGMCKGGVVKGYAEGGFVDPVTGRGFEGMTADEVRALAAQPQPVTILPEPGQVTVSDLPPGSPGIMDRIGAALDPEVAAIQASRTPPATQPPPYLMQPDAAPAPAMPAAPPPPTGPMLPDFGTYMKDVRGFQKQFAGMGGVGEAHRAAEESARIGQDAQVEYARQQAEMAARQKQYEADVKGFMGEYDRALDDFKNSRIDPNRFWNSRSDGQKVTALIGLALGGIGSGLTGGPNSALQILEKSIDRDFEAQRMEMGKKQNLVSMLYQKFGTIDAAQNAFRLYKAAEISAYANKTAAQLGGAQARMHAAQIQQAAAQFATQNAMALAQMKMNYGFMQSMLGGQGGGQSQYAGGAAPAMPKTFDMAGIQEAAAANRERAIPGPQPGTQVLAQDAGAAKVARDRLAGAEAFKQTLGQLETLRRTGVSPIPGLDSAAAWQRLRMNAGAEYARMVTGNPSGNMVEEGMKMIPGNAEQAIRGRTGFQPAYDAIESQRRAVYKTYAGIDLKPIAAPEHKAR